MRDGHWYALPVNIHGANWLFYNTKVFADAGIPEPKTWSDLLAAGPKLKAKGVIPFAHGGQAWQDHLLFDAVLAGEGGSDLYLSVYGKDPEKAIASPGFKHVAEVFKQLGGLIGSGAHRPRRLEHGRLRAKGRRAAEGPEEAAALHHLSHLAG
jgi:glucose/mannose transport system substrate-binding protein